MESLNSTDFCAVATVACKRGWLHDGDLIPLCRPQDYFPHRRGERREQDYLEAGKEPSYGSPAWEEWNRLREFELRLLRKEQELREREEARRQASGVEADHPAR